jgi:hypothetical protein
MILEQSQGTHVFMSVKERRQTLVTLECETGQYTMHVTILSEA